jgi:uncharacterized membrane protein YeiH
MDALALDTAYQVLFVSGTVAFSISGALTAMEKRFDPFGVLIIAFSTAVGGGTIRDILIGKTAFWLQDTLYLYLILLGTIISLFFRKKLDYLRNTLMFFDTMGLGLFTILGAQIGLANGLSDISSLVLATITGTFGGVLRDVLVNDVPVIFRREIYATISIVGAALFLFLRKFEYFEYSAPLIPVFFIILIRFWVVHYKIALPNIYKK